MCIATRYTSIFLGGVGTWGLGASAPSHFKMREYEHSPPTNEKCLLSEIHTILRYCYKFKYHFKTHSVYN